MNSSQLADILALTNDVVQAIIVIFGSAVVLFYSNRLRRSAVTRAFILLIGGGGWLLHFLSKILYAVYLSTFFLRLF